MVIKAINENNITRFIIVFFRFLLLLFYFFYCKDKAKIDKLYQSLTLFYHIFCDCFTFLLITHTIFQINTFSLIFLQFATPAIEQHNKQQRQAYTLSRIHQLHNYKLQKTATKHSRKLSIFFYTESES